MMHLILKGKFVILSTSQFVVLKVPSQMVEVRDSCDKLFLRCSIM